MLLYTILLFFIAGTNAFAQSYYVKADGNDQLDGTSDERAWKTISRVNSFKFNSGDDVYFKCNDTWINQRLYIDWSGTATDRVIIGSYYGTGTKDVSGAKPVIDGKYISPSNEWTGLVVVAAQDYITVENLRVINTKGHGINAFESDYINVISCDVDKAYQQGIGFEKNCNYGMIKGCSVTDAGRVGIETSQNWPCALGLAKFCTNIIISGNTVYGNHGEGIGLYQKSDNCIVENNFVYENRRVNIYNGESRNNIIRYNLIYGTDASAAYVGIGVDDEDWRSGYTENLKIYGNMIANCSKGFYLETTHPDSVFRNNKIYNNTVVDCLINLYSSSGPYENSEIKNNIFWCISDNCTQTKFAPTKGGVTFDYNLWSSTPESHVKGQNDLSYSSPALERTTGWRSLEGKNVTISDFSLQKGSPAINAGTNIIGSSYNELVNIYQNNLITTASKLKQSENGFGWEIGAAIFSEDGAIDTPPPPPSNLKIGLN